MVVNCEEVWREISNYLDGEIDGALRAAMDEHIRGCKRCTAVLEGTRNVIQLYGDERMQELPLGFHARLQHRLEGTMPRRTFLGWMVAAAAAIIVASGFEFARSASPKVLDLRSAHAQPGNHVPPELMVVVAEDGKTFHVPGCPFLHDKTKTRTMTAAEAEHDGYSPCIRCLRKYLAVALLEERPDDATDLGQ